MMKSSASWFLRPERKTFNLIILSLIFQPWYRVNSVRKQDILMILHEKVLNKLTASTTQETSSRENMEEINLVLKQQVMQNKEKRVGMMELHESYPHQLLGFRLLYSRNRFLIPKKQDKGTLILLLTSLRFLCFSFSPSKSSSFISSRRSNKKILESAFILLARMLARTKNTLLYPILVE